MLRIRIKTRPRAQDQSTIRLDRFFSLYFQNMFSELNAVLSDYHSIQEHASRNRIIEFVSKKLKDLDLLQVFISGACLLKSLHYLKLKGDDCSFYGHRILEMADFLGMLHENMKTSFIPRANFSLALQTQLDYRKLLPVDVYRTLDVPSLGNPFVSTAQEAITEADFAYIHRLMRIYLLKENIGTLDVDGIHSSIENGILSIQSCLFTFELALCGQFQAPQWLLFNVRSYTGIKKVEEQLMRRLTSIDLIIRFIRFFENRKKALVVFNLFESKSGFYQSFTGTVADAECKGYFKGNDFYFRIASPSQTRELKNPTADEVKQYVFCNPVVPVQAADALSIEGRSVELKPEIFGPNRAYFAHGMFFCLGKTQNVCFFGRSLPVCGMSAVKLHLKRDSSQVVAFSSDEETRNAEPLIPLNEFVVFVECNIDFLMVAFLIKDLGLSYKIGSSLVSESFRVDTSQSAAAPLALQYIGHNKAGVPITLTNSRIKTVLIGDVANRIRLIALQENPPADMEILESQPGTCLTLQFLGIHINASPVVTTSIKELSEDVRHFNLTAALQYIRRFAVFYTHHLMPTVTTANKICIDLTNFVDEVVEITACDGGYAISGPKTLKISKAPRVFKMTDMKVFHILYKIFLTDRFIFLKKSFERADGNSSSDEIRLDGQRRIYLTQEGIRFIGGDGEVDWRITNALNFERDILGYFSKV